MSSEETYVMQLLRKAPSCFHSLEDIARLSCDMEFAVPDIKWVVPGLVTLLQKGLVEVNDLGAFRLLQPA